LGRVSENEKKKTLKKHIIDKCRVMSPEFKFITHKVEESIVMYTFVTSLNQSRRN